MTDAEIGAKVADVQWLSRDAADPQYLNVTRLGCAELAASYLRIIVDELRTRGWAEKAAEAKLRKGVS